MELSEKEAQGKLSLLPITMRLHRLCLALDKNIRINPFDIAAPAYSSLNNPSSSRTNDIELPTQQQSHPPEPIYSPYSTAAPLGSLTNAAAVVDCPSCGHRDMTRTEVVRGTTTRYVNSSSILS